VKRHDYLDIVLLSFPLLVLVLSFRAYLYPSETLPDNISEDYILVPSPSPAPFSESEDNICIVDDFLNDHLAEEILNADLSNEEIFPF